MWYKITKERINDFIIDLVQSFHRANGIGKISYTLSLKDIPEKGISDEVIDNLVALVGGAGEALEHVHQHSNVLHRQGVMHSKLKS